MRVDILGEDSQVEPNRGEKPDWGTFCETGSSRIALLAEGDTSA